MKLRLADENLQAETLIPPARPDGSGVGVNYADDYIKSLNVALADGRQVVCKRKGLKITLQIGDAAGESLLRRLEHGPDVRLILRRALEEAAANAGARFFTEAGGVWLEV